jgi:hypothetical protein
MCKMRIGDLAARYPVELGENTRPQVSCSCLSCPRRTRVRIASTGPIFVSDGGLVWVINVVFSHSLDNS